MAGDPNTIQGEFPSELADTERGPPLGIASDDINQDHKVAGFAHPVVWVDGRRWGGGIENASIDSAVGDGNTPTVTGSISDSLTGSGTFTTNAFTATFSPTGMRPAAHWAWMWLVSPTTTTTVKGVIDVNQSFTHLGQKGGSHLVSYPDGGSIWETENLTHLSVVTTITPSQSLSISMSMGTYALDKSLQMRGSWYDGTSTFNVGYQPDGAMGTYHKVKLQALSEEGGSIDASFATRSIFASLNYGGFERTSINMYQNFDGD